MSTNDTSREPQLPRKQLPACSYTTELQSVSCERRDGTVELSGRVSSYYFKQLAQEFARQSNPTRQIVNKIRVVPDHQAKP